MTNKNYLTADEEYSQILGEIALEFELDDLLLNELIQYEQDKVHLQKRRGAKNEIRRIIERWIEKT